MRKIIDIHTILISAFLLLPVAGLGQEVYRLPATFKAIGNASSSLSSPLSVFSNPAGAAKSGFSAGILYDNRFLVKDLTTRSAFLVAPVFQNCLLFSYSQFGNDYWRETRMSFGLSRELSPLVTAGLQFHYFSLLLAENDKRPSTLLTDLGVQFHFKDAGLGMQLFNPFAFAGQDDRKELEYPWAVRVGTHKTFQQVFLVAAELYKQQGDAVEPRFGVQYLIKEQLSLRCGVETKTGVYSLGVGTVFRAVHADLAFSYHTVLGLSPSVAIYFLRP